MILLHNDLTHFRIFVFSKTSRSPSSASGGDLFQLPHREGFVYVESGSDDDFAGGDDTDQSIRDLCHLLGESHL